MSTLRLRERSHSDERRSLRRSPLPRRPSDMRARLLSIERAREVAFSTPTKTSLRHDHSSPHKCEAVACNPGPRSAERVPDPVLRKGGTCGQRRCGGRVRARIRETYHEPVAFELRLRECIVHQSISFRRAETPVDERGAYGDGDLDQ
jgi:hypothetical protein